MVSVIAEELITVLLAVVQMLGTSNPTVGLIASILGMLDKLMPQIMTLSAQLIQSVQSVIDGLRNSGVPLTADQVAALDAATDACFAAFEAAANAADAAPGAQT